MKKQPIIIIGHKNPDLDSIASAIAYARLKQLEGESNVIAGTAGELNNETVHVLKKLGIKPRSGLKMSEPGLKTSWPMRRLRTCSARICDCRKRATCSATANPKPWR